MPVTSNYSLNKSAIISAVLHFIQCIDKLHNNAFNILRKALTSPLNYLSKVTNVNKALFRATLDSAPAHNYIAAATNELNCYFPGSFEFWL